MKWFGRRQSDNVDDRRGFSGGKVAAGGGIIGIIALIITFLGGDGDTGAILQQLEQQQQPTQTVALTEEDKKMGEFVRVVLADTEDVWRKLFSQQGLTYEEPTLVLFRDGVQTECGGATSQSGPFYCPVDRKVYMDLAFFDELRTRFGAKGGDFAIAYVIAHEIGHHVQNLLGTSGEVHQARQQSSEREGNKLSVALELQADYYAGVWAHHDQQLNQMLEEGDIDEALSAANAVGDDAIQKKVQGTVVPDSFTHGTSEQRMRWFRKGFETGDFKGGNALFQ
jgi:uncharacterized protein